jgi:hypothetical protein
MPTRCPSHDDAPDPEWAQTSRRRRPYSAPTLTYFGEVRGMTLGASPGVGDSGPLARNPRRKGPSPYEFDPTLIDHESLG